AHGADLGVTRHVHPLAGHRDQLTVPTDPQVGTQLDGARHERPRPGPLHQVEHLRYVRGTETDGLLVGNGVHAVVHHLHTGQPHGLHPVRRGRRRQTRDRRDLPRSEQPGERAPCGRVRIVGERHERRDVRRVAQDRSLPEGEMGVRTRQRGERGVVQHRRVGHTDHSTDPAHAGRRDFRPHVRTTASRPRAPSPPLATRAWEKVREGTRVGNHKSFDLFSGSAASAPLLSGVPGTMDPVADSGILSTGRAFICAVAEACATTVSDADMIDLFRDTGTIQDQLLAAQVFMVGELIRRGAFTAHGYTRPEYAIADLLGWDRRPARRRVRLAEQVCPRSTLDGQPLPALLPATATVFAEGRITVAVAEAIVAVLTGPAALRLPTDIWAAVEEQVAHYAATHRLTPVDITGWARQLVQAYDQDGPPPEHEPELVNELRLSRKPCGTGGCIRGELDGPTFEAVVTAIGALSGTRPDVQRSVEQRQADALGEICGFSLSHDDTLPDTGGERPQIRL